jgi:glycosyltransferase involved in cell wall biosynthesis
MPKVRIVTPCYNAAPYVERTILSVRRQTFADWEYVLVDDGSTDDSAAVVARVIAGDPRMRLVRQANRGVSHARNFGVDALLGAPDYYVFLDADDLLMPTYLEVMAGHMDAHREVGLAYCGYLAIGDDDVLLQGQERGRLPDRFVPRGLSLRRIPHDQAETPLEAMASYHEAIPSVCIVRRSVFERTARWRPVGLCEDKDFALGMAMRAPVHRVPQHLLLYRRHADSMSSVGVSGGLRRIHRVWWEGQGLTPAQRRRVRRALVFDRQVSAALATGSARDAWRAGAIGSAGRYTLAAGKRYGEAIIGAVRLLVAGPRAAPAAGRG